ncbi:MAG: transposase [Shewanella sp.]|nr:transposase [Shewanella sp.]
MNATLDTNGNPFHNPIPLIFYNERGKIMVKSKRTFYPPEFKIKAVALAEEKGVALASEELGISSCNISRWRNKQSGELDADTKEDQITEELFKCRQEIAMLKSQLAIYKNVVKATLKEFDPEF